MVLGGIEYSVEYIMLWNLLSRCEGCRRRRRGNGCVMKDEWKDRVKTIAPGNKIRKPKRKESGEALPCVFSCSKIHVDDIECYDVLRFEELQQEFEPVDDERFVQDAFVEVDDG